MTGTRGRARAGRGDEVSELDKRIIEHLQADGRRPVHPDRRTSSG